MFASMVIGSIPRMGKTFAARLLLLAAALDLRAELHVYDLKGTGDLSVLEPVAHRYRAGDDDSDIAYALADLRELQAELRRRAKVIRELPRDLCPENKVTPHLAGLKTYRLHPIVLGVDECQRWFEHSTYGSELQAISEDLVRRGPALGIIPIFATQRPDAKSLPTAISANAVLRFCLKVMGQVENDMVLGTSAYKNGVRATMFARSDRGIGYLAGEGDDPQIVRSFYVDAPAAEHVVARARRAAGAGRHPHRPRPRGGPRARRRRREPAGRHPGRGPRRPGQGLEPDRGRSPGRAAPRPVRRLGARAAHRRAQAPRGQRRAGVGHRPGHRRRRESPRHHPRPGHRGRRACPPPAPRPPARMRPLEAPGGPLRLAPTPLGLAAPLAADPPADQPPNS